jgi:hypothetical protein
MKKKKTLKKTTMVRTDDNTPLGPPPPTHHNDDDLQWINVLAAAIGDERRWLHRSSSLFQAYLIVALGVVYIILLLSNNTILQLVAIAVSPFGYMMTSGSRLQTAPFLVADIIHLCLAIPSFSLHFLWAYVTARFVSIIAMRRGRIRASSPNLRVVYVLVGLLNHLLSTIVIVISRPDSTEYTFSLLVVILESTILVGPQL